MGKMKSGLVSWSCEKYGVALEHITDKRMCRISALTLLHQKQLQQLMKLAA
jgi:hypothetical protein